MCETILQVESLILTMTKEHNEPKSTNATQRVVDILSALDHTNTGKTTADALVDVIGAKSDDRHRSALLAYATFTKLLETAEVEARKYYAREWEELVAPHFAGVRACFTPSQSGVPWNQRKPSLTAADLTGLKHTAGHLMRHVHEVEITEDEKKPLEEAIAALEEVLQARHISEYSRQVLQEKLDRLKTALTEYKLWGVAEVGNVYRDFAGTLMTDVQVYKDLRQDRKKGGGVVKGVFLVITTATALMTFATQAHDVKHDYLPTIKKHFLPPKAPGRKAPQKRLPAPSPQTIEANT